MSRIVISCIIFMLCARGSHLVPSGDVTSDIGSGDVTADIDEGVQTEIEIPASGNLRLSLGLALGEADCRHIGRTCFVYRDNADKPTKVNYAPCCQYLICVGIGPNEIKNFAGTGHHSDDLYSTGICSLSLDNNQAAKDLNKYKTYVKGL